MLPIAPPFPNENAFYCRFFLDLGSYLDEDNRRLHEVDFRFESDAQAYGRCPFKDSRHGYMMNKAALRQIAAHWENVLSALRFFAAVTGKKSEDESLLERAWRVTMSTMFAPMYLFKRRENPFLNGQLPVAVAGLFKIMLDVPTTIDLMLITSSQETTSECGFTEIREFADSNGILLNGEFACAGSPGLIDEVLSILFDDVLSEWSSNVQFESYFPKQKEFLLFTYYMSCQYIISLVYQLSTAFTMEFAFSDLASSGLYTPVALPNADRLPAYERRRRISLWAMMRCSDLEAVFKRLVRLVENEQRWHVLPEKRVILLEFLADTLSFCALAFRSNAGDILNAHQNYEVKFQNCVRLLQEEIERTIGTPGVFPGQPVLGPSKQLPATLLSHIIRESQGRLRG